MRLRFLPMVVIAAAASVPLASQTIRRGAVVQPDLASESVLILREIDAATQAGYGTMLATHALEVRRRVRALADLALVDAADAAATLHVGPWSTGSHTLDITEVTVDAPRILGLQVLGGRGFTPDDLLADGRVGLLTNGAWQQYFESSLSVVGGRGTIATPDRRESVTIVGVLAPSAIAAPEVASSTGLLVLSRAEFQGAREGERWYAPVVKLRPGVSAGEVQRVLDEAATDVRRREPGSDVAFRLESLRLRER